MRSKKIINLMPFITAILITGILLNLMKNRRDWEPDLRVINWDIVSYYAYLPATFIYHDCTLKFTENYKGPHHFIIWPDKGPNNSKVIRTSMGMSVLYSPFFFIAHFYAITHNFDAGGYSVPYRVALLLSCLFYLLIGLLYLAKLLLKFFNPLISSWVMLITVFGTNLLYYTFTYASPVTHAYNFSLIIIFIYYSIKWHENPSIKNSITLGLMAGIISLVRPTNIIVVIFFILWNIKSFTDLRDRFSLFIKKWWLILIIISMFFLVWLPQLLYWKFVTGQFFYYSYGNEKDFYFLHPHIIKGFFSYRKGWLLYTPSMILAIAGIPLLWKYCKELFWPVTILFALHVYIVFSWWCWWYGGCFGSRPMIDIYGVLALPLGTFFTYIITTKNFIRWPVMFFSAFLLLIGAFHTDKYLHESIHYDSMTKESFWDSYFRRSPKGTYWKLLDPPNYEQAHLGLPESTKSK